MLCCAVLCCVFGPIHGYTPHYFFTVGPPNAVTSYAAAAHAAFASAYANVAQTADASSPAEPWSTLRHAVPFRAITDATTISD